MMVHLIWSKKEDQRMFLIDVAFAIRENPGKC